MTNTSVPSIDQFISTLKLTQYDLGRYLYPFIFFLGNIGSVLNIFVLSKRVYRQSSCSYYVLSSSITNLFIINIPVLLRCLELGFDVNLNGSLVLCRCREYITHVTGLLSRIYIILACVDRWAMSSANIRRHAFSQIEVAKAVSLYTAVCVCIISVHAPVSYHLVEGRCSRTSLTYSIFSYIYETFLTGFLTPLTMMIFGLLTIQNIKRSRQRIHLQTDRHRNAVHTSLARVHRKSRSREYEVLIMILVQFAVYLLTCLPLPTYLIYMTLSLQWAKSNAQRDSDRFLSTIAYTLANINFSATFYIYILTARTFRKDLIQPFVSNRVYRFCCRNRPNAGTTQEKIFVLNN